MKYVTAVSSLLLTLFLVGGAHRIFPADSDLEISFIDVGYGDSMLIENPGGGCALIDTGYPEVRDKLFAFLERRGVREIEHFIITHPHADHLGNAVAVLNRFEVRRVYDNGQRIDRFSQRLTPEMAREYENGFRGRGDYRVLKAGDEIGWGDVTLEVIWPPDTTGREDWNTNSLVILLRRGDLRVLLAGDCNETGEIELLKDRKKGSLESAGDSVRAHLLKVGHHGGGDATTPAFLKKVAPRWAVISVGDNPWGYPSGQVISRLAECGILGLRTDQDGDITFRFSPSDSVEIYCRRFFPLLTRLR